MLIWPLFLFITVWAESELWDEYCFSNPLKMQRIKDEIKFIIISTDQFQHKNNCFLIKTLPHRRELIQESIKIRDPNVSIKYSSENSINQPCEIMLEKIKTISNNQAKAVERLPSSSDAEKQDIRKEFKEIFSIHTKKDFEFTFNENQIKGQCRAKSSNIYIIEFEMKNNSNLTLEVKSGDKIEIGQLLKTEAQNNNNTDSTNEFFASQSNIFKDEKIYLMMNKSNAIQK